MPPHPQHTRRHTQTRVPQLQPPSHTRNRQVRHCSLSGPPWEIDSIAGPTTTNSIPPDPAKAHAAYLHLYPTHILHTTQDSRGHIRAPKPPIQFSFDADSGWSLGFYLVLGLQLDSLLTGARTGCWAWTTKPRMSRPPGEGSEVVRSFPLFS